MGRLPMESATAPENVVTTVAPMRDMATIRPSIRGSLCKLNSFFMYKTAPAEIRHQVKQGQNKVKLQYQLKFSEHLDWDGNKLQIERSCVVDPYNYLIALGIDSKSLRKSPLGKLAIGQ